MECQGSGSGQQAVQAARRRSRGRLAAVVTGVAASCEQRSTCVRDPAERASRLGRGGGAPDVLLGFWTWMRDAVLLDPGRGSSSKRGLGRV